MARHKIIKCFIVLSFYLLCPGSVIGQPVINLQWEHSGENISGFYLYSGPSPESLTKLLELSSDKRSFFYSQLDGSLVCFGISAFNSAGESEVVKKTDLGEDVCINKIKKSDKFYITGDVKNVSGLYDQIYHPNKQTWKSHWCAARETVCLFEKEVSKLKKKKWSKCSQAFQPNCKDIVKSPQP